MMFSGIRFVDQANVVGDRGQKVEQRYGDGNGDQVGEHVWHSG